MGDTLRAHWSAWVVAAELPGWPLDTLLAGFPAGVDLVALPPISLALVAPVSALFGATLGLVAMLILHTSWSVLGGAFFARSLGARDGAALASGLLLATTPILGESLRSGIYEYQTIGWMAWMMGSLVHACRGSWRWGMAAGVFYLLTLLECGYYGSAAALAAPVVVLSIVRSRSGAIGASVAALTVAVGALCCHELLSPILERLQGHMQSSPEAGAGTLSLAELMAALPFVGWSDPYNGMPQPFHAAPSVLLWIGAITGLVFRWRELGWMALLSLCLLLLATGSPAMDWWAHSELGRHVGMPKRLLAPLAVVLCGLAAAGLSDTLDRWREGAWSWKGSLMAGALAAAISAQGNGLWTDYPLLWTPADPEFITQLRSSPTEGAVIILPQEQPEDPQNRRTFQPLLSEDPSFANPQARLWWQTRMDRAMRHHSRLGTLVARSDTNLRLDEMPGSHGSIVDPKELSSLTDQGLAAVVIDHGQLAPGVDATLRRELEESGAECSIYDDWSGVSLCWLSPPQGD